jgi:hypothetical protein
MDLGRWWSDHWEFAVGAFIGVPGLFALWFQRRPKTLDFRVVTSVAIVSQHAAQLREKLHVSYGNRKLDEPWVTVVRIVNTGKQAVRRDDFVDPVEIRFEEAQPLDAFISNESSPGLLRADEVWELDEDEKSINNMTPFLAQRPRLMNGGDWYELQIISEGMPGHITARARFADQSRPMRNELRKEMRLSLMQLMIAAVLFAAAGFVIHADEGSGHSPVMRFIGNSLLTASIATLMGIVAIFPILLWLGRLPKLFYSRRE